GSSTRPASARSGWHTCRRTACCTAFPIWYRGRRPARRTASTPVPPGIADWTRGWPRARRTRAGSPRSAGCSPRSPGLPRTWPTGQAERREASGRGRSAHVDVAAGAPVEAVFAGEEVLVDQVPADRDVVVVPGAQDRVDGAFRVPEAGLEAGGDVLQDDPPL